MCLPGHFHDRSAGSISSCYGRMRFMSVSRILRLTSVRIHLFLLSLAVVPALTLLAAQPAGASGKPVHVKLIVAGREQALSAPVLADEFETYAPLDVLKVV